MAASNARMVNVLPTHHCVILLMIVGTTLMSWAVHVSAYWYGRSEWQLVVPPAFTCPDGHFLCNNSHPACVRDHTRCDGNNDCDDGSDEKDCGKLISCKLVKVYHPVHQPASLNVSIMLVIIVYMSSLQLSRSTLCVQWYSPEVYYRGEMVRWNNRL